MMPRRPRLPLQHDYSVTEAAIILDISRATAYNWIKKGTIHAVLNDYGDYRVTPEEINRLKAMLEQLPPGPRDQRLIEAKRRAIARANGHRRASRLTKEEIAAPLTAGRRRAYENQVEQHHPGLRYTNPAEFERMVEQAEKDHMARMSAAGYDARLRQTLAGRP